MIKPLLTYLSLLISITCFSQHTKFCSTLDKVVKLVELKHYSPKPINDSLSKAVFKRFIAALDERKQFFTQEDISVFKADELQLDDYISENNCSFIIKYAEKLQSRITNSKDYILALKDKTLDYSGADSLNFYAKKDYKFFKNETKAIKYWDKRVRYRILQKVVEDSLAYDDLKKTFKAKEAKLKSKVIENEICIIKAFEQQKGSIEEFVAYTFLNTFLEYQDPNSSFFTNSEKALFEQSVGNSQLSFGITTNKLRNGDIVISNIAPGSPAFKNGNFDVNDILLAVETLNETLETYCTSNEIIASFINDSDIKTVTFKIKKQNGTIKRIGLTKTNIDIEENTITGFLLKDKITIGYIDIPSFYTSLESFNGFGVANDVAKQIYKLQRQSIEGLIIDLRLNGGGSMKEAIDLAGMFIDRGPIVISKANEEEPYTVRDPNRGTLFSKPIVILVNQFSASASELFAAVLQDYNIAIIVGSHTFGKASSQVIFPLDETNRDYVKLTVGQFFRVTGKSHQKIGVQPHMVLPSIYDNFNQRETDKDFALQNYSITPIVLHRPKNQKDLNAIETLSKKRVANKSIFKSIKTFNKNYRDNYINRVGSYPLNLEFIYNDNKNHKALWNTYQTEINNNSVLFKAENTPSTNNIIKYNDDDMERNKTLRLNIEKDPYVQEAYQIIIDYLKT